MRDGAAALAIGLVLGAGVVAGSRTLEGDATGSTRTDDEASVEDLSGVDEDAVSRPLAGVEDPGNARGAGEPARVAAPKSPDEALDAFLEAEIARDFDESYGYLSAADRASYAARDLWIDAHAYLPRVLDADAETPRVDGTRAEATSAVRFEPRLDEIVGLVPERARVTWALAAEDGGWRVALSESSFTPAYPDERGAVDAARAWASARQACRTSGEWYGGLLGLAADAYANELCDADGEITLAPVERLGDGPEAEPFIAAFGAGVLDWARVVPVESPAPVRVVLAPLGEQWLVVGALQDSSSGARDEPS
jgi:hypothetical protein